MRNLPPVLLVCGCICTQCTSQTFPAQLCYNLLLSITTNSKTRQASEVESRSVRLLPLIASWRQTCTTDSLKVQFDLMLNLISCVLSFSSWNYNRYGYMGVLCLQHHLPPPLKSSGVSREKRRRLFPLHRLCLICNQLISSASIPSGQLTNTVLLS